MCGGVHGESIAMGLVVCKHKNISICGQIAVTCWKAAAEDQKDNVWKNKGNKKFYRTTWYIWVTAVIEEQSSKMGYVCSYWIMIILLLWEKYFSNMIPGIQLMDKI